MVDNFFPYSQKNLDFDQPVTIIFQSDDENASKMLGKTAYYDPENFEVILYTDNRHPKDVMRSLSHELVHHAQNCRGDLQKQCDSPSWDPGAVNGARACVKDTDVGYAQRDPHMRKMEREAYTKGNLIFRDFEDLIKTGKINIEIDFSDSGEPKMSLKEWKNDEIHTRLLKKWGFGLLKESRIPESEPELEPQQDPPDPRERDPRDPSERAGEPEQVAEDTGEEQVWDDWKNEHEDDDHIEEIEHHLRALKDDRDYERHGAEYDHDKYEDEGDPDMKEESVYWRNEDGDEDKPPVGEGKVSIREAKEITRRIIERIKKESN
tara:strand:- start:4297 stop:5259 length:963 start_codon:yes stop_codon:yes gene_type:complete